MKSELSTVRGEDLARKTGGYAQKKDSRTGCKSPGYTWACGTQAAGTESAGGAWETGGAQVEVMAVMPGYHADLIQEPVGEGGGGGVGD